MLLSLIDHDAIDTGWTLTRVCGVWELDRQPAWRWKHRQLVGALDDAHAETTTQRAIAADPTLSPERSGCISRQDG